MATTSVLAATLPKLIVIKSKDYSDKGYAYYKEEGEGSGSVVLGEENVFSTLAKIAVERATISDKYVNLRFLYTNRYWVRKADDNKFIVAESDKPQEDITKAKCTLFEALKEDGDKEEVFYLRHVQSGGRVSIDGPTMAFFVDENPEEKQGYLTFVDWNTLVILPKTVAIRGDTGLYLASLMGRLLFDCADPNAGSAIFEVELMADGHIQIYNQFEGLYMTVDEDDPSRQIRLFGLASSPPNWFWPVKLDDNTIALRCAYNNLFARRGEYDRLYATGSTITKETKIQLKELVLGRKINNVRYLMEYARIFDEAPFVAGTATLINDTYSEASLGVEVQYEDSKSYTFSRSTSLTAGVSSTIEAGLPFIESASITVSYEINGALQWDETETTTKTLNGTGSVPVPARTTAKIEYVGTRGSCNVPYTYTQEDQSSTDGSTIYSEHVDGIYTAVNYYSFNFHIVSTEPLPT